MSDRSAKLRNAGKKYYFTSERRDLIIKNANRALAQAEIAADLIREGGVDGGLIAIEGSILALQNLLATIKNGAMPE
jgi:hypothetical protein